VTLRTRLACKLATLAERLDPDFVFRSTSFTFTFEHRRGALLRDDGQGCPLWYCQPDHDRAWREADTDWQEATSA
jgi:hypothetical protein